jgi:hypothetical protein
VSIFCSIAYTLFALIVFFLIAFISNFEFFTLLVLFAFEFSFFALMITSFIKFAFFRIVQCIQTNTYFTTNFTFILSSVKLRNRFNFFAFTTSFCYDCFRHLLLLIRSKCLEPFTRPILVRGLFYYRVE